MAHTTLIAAEELAAHLGDPGWVVVDCRFDLADPARGRRDYLAGHVAGAVYADLDEDLSGPIVRGVTGRHPLPTVERAAAVCARLGIGDGTQVVAYDDRGGMSSGRLWWLLRWLGHEAVAVLDGGWQAWVALGGATRDGEETRPARPEGSRFTPRPRPELAVDAAAVLALRDNADYKVIDSRAADRYRGENETIDPVGGHIPGALSGPFAENLGPDGRFRSPEELRARFAALLGETPAERAVFYCGSGVSAAHNLLALAHAGLGEARLYPGSWSEWIVDPDRPVATGPEPDPARPR